MYLLLPKKKLKTKKILKVELEYWLHGITTLGLEEPGSQWTSALNRNELQVSKILRHKCTHKRRKKPKGRGKTLSLCC